MRATVFDPPVDLEVIENPLNSASRDRTEAFTRRFHQYTTLVTLVD